jgi:hypothetical protein
MSSLFLLGSFDNVMVVHYCVQMNSLAAYTLSLVPSFGEPDKVLYLELILLVLRCCENEAECVQSRYERSLSKIKHLQVLSVGKFKPGWLKTLIIGLIKSSSEMKACCKIGENRKIATYEYDSDIFELTTYSKLVHCTSSCI